MTQDELKRAAALAALDFVLSHVPEGAVIGVGTGSTANFFIDALAGRGLRGAVSSSAKSADRLRAAGVPLVDLDDVDELPVYVDGADEVVTDGVAMPAASGYPMIKGGGGALTREKIVAAVSRRFVCIVDDSKRVARLGRFPLPVEVIPMARRHVTGELERLGGAPKLREGFVTDNGNLILDVAGLEIADPDGLEARINDIVGVVTNGLFARRGADIVLSAAPGGVLRFGA